MYSVEDIMLNFGFNEKLATNVYNKTPENIIKLCTEGVGCKDIEIAHKVKHQLRAIVPLYGDPVIQEIVDNMSRGQSLFEMQMAFVRVISLVAKTPHNHSENSVL